MKSSRGMVKLGAAMVASALLVACGDATAPGGAPTSEGATTGGAGAGGSPSEGGAGGAGGASPCLVNEVDLELTITRDGVADSQVVPIRYEGVDGYLAIDTGSPLTFVFGAPGDPEYVEHAGDVEVGCELYPVSSLTLDAVGREPFNGKPILGIVGMDFFSEVPTEIDYPARRVVRYLEGGAPDVGLTAVDVDWTGVRIVVDASLDDEPVRLIYDAGSPHTLWVGQVAQPGDEEVVLGTADGGTVLVYEGDAALDFATDREVIIPVWRTPAFPYLEEELIELDADGLLGATGLGFRRIVFDLGASRMFLGPRVAPSR